MMETILRIMEQSMRYGIKPLMETLESWNEFLPGREQIHLIACGGTALTLLGYKESTADIDFIVPVESEHKHLTQFLEKAGYSGKGEKWKHPNDGFMIFDLFRGNKVYTTDLLDSPLEEGRNKKIREWNKIYLGVLNGIDLIITKLFRGTEVDMDDCKILLKNEKINFTELKERYEETVKYSVWEDKVLANFARFLIRLKEDGISYE